MSKQTDQGQPGLGGQYIDQLEELLRGIEKDSVR